MGYQTNADYISARTSAARARRGRSHQLGLCGGHADLCPACAREEYDAMLAWARTQPRPVAGETPGDYARRIDMPMFDAWYAVAVKIIAES